MFKQEPVRWITWRGKHIPIGEDGKIIKFSKEDLETIKARGKIRMELDEIPSQSGKAFHLKEKYKDYVGYVGFRKLRDYYTSGPGTGKGSKGTHYIYQFDTRYYGKGRKNKLGLSLYADNAYDLEEKIIKQIKKEE